MNFRIFLSLILLSLTFGGCKKCSTCEDLPNDVTQLQGEWEWVYTQRQFFTDNGSLFNDTIAREQMNSTVILTITNDGCYNFKVDDCEYNACIDVFRTTLEEDTIPVYECREEVAMNLEGKDISAHASAEVLGQDCHNMNSLHGLNVPFNTLDPYLTPPDVPFNGLVLNSYKNHFIRVK